VTTHDVATGDARACALQASAQTGRSRFRLTPFAMVTVLGVGAPLLEPGCSLFVDGRASFGGNGNSWADALPDLRTALFAAPASPEGPLTDVCVAEGRYPPAQPGGDLDGGDLPLVLAAEVATTTRTGWCHSAARSRCSSSTRVDPSHPRCSRTSRCADGLLGTPDDDLRLAPNSRLIDAGNSTAVPASVTVDLDGQPRFADLLATPATGIGGTRVVDMGGYERL
jgi:hypothetical protein